jgi:LmbE family N-acetylglucosaminyl deacetylase
MNNLAIFAFMKLDILAVGVHPDDVELAAAGTIMKHIDLGYKVGILDLTEGQLGSRGSGDISYGSGCESESGNG